MIKFTTKDEQNFNLFAPELLSEGVELFNTDDIPEIQSEHLVDIGVAKVYSIFNRYKDALRNTAIAVEVSSLHVNNTEFPGPFYRFYNPKRLYQGLIKASNVDKETEILFSSVIVVKMPGENNKVFHSYKSVNCKLAKIEDLDTIKSYEDILQVNDRVISQYEPFEKRFVHPMALAMNKIKGYLSVLEDFKNIKSFRKSGEDPFSNNVFLRLQVTNKLVEMCSSLELDALVVDGADTDSLVIASTVAAMLAIPLYRENKGKDPVFVKKVMKFQLYRTTKEDEENGLDGLICLFDDIKNENKNIYCLTA